MTLADAILSTAGAGCAAISVYGATEASALPQATPTDVPWDVITSGGATAAVIVVMVLLLKYFRDDRKDFAATIERGFEKLAASMGERLEAVAERFCESNERVAQALRDMAQEIRVNKPKEGER